MVHIVCYTCSCSIIVTDNENVFIIAFFFFFAYISIYLCLCSVNVLNEATSQNVLLDDRVGGLSFVHGLTGQPDNIDCFWIFCFFPKSC